MHSPLNSMIIKDFSSEENYFVHKKRFLVILCLDTVRMYCENVEL